MAAKKKTATTKKAPAKKASPKKSQPIATLDKAAKKVKGTGVLMSKKERDELLKTPKIKMPKKKKGK